jgi:hypothetical protein
VAIPLDTVTRLEEFPRDRIEHAGSREVVQYRGQILPLVRLSHLLGAAGAGEGVVLQGGVLPGGGDAGVADGSHGGYCTVRPLSGTHDRTLFV